MEEQYGHLRTVPSSERLQHIADILPTKFQGTGVKQSYGAIYDMPFGASITGQESGTEVSGDNTISESLLRRRLVYTILRPTAPFPTA